MSFGTKSREMMIMEALKYYSVLRSQEARVLITCDFR